MAYRMTPARRAALKKAQIASARKRKKGVRAKVAYRRKTSKEYRSAKRTIRYAARDAAAKRNGYAVVKSGKKYRPATRKAKHDQAVMRGAAVGTFVAGPAGTLAGAAAGKVYANRRHGKLTTRGTNGKRLVRPR